MKILKQLFILLFFTVVGETISILIRLVVPSLLIPGTLLGMLFLFLALIYRVVKPESLDELGSFITSNMSFFFLPASISILAYLELLEATIGKILLLILITLLLSYLAIGFSLKLTRRLLKKKGGISS